MSDGGLSVSACGIGDAGVEVVEFDAESLTTLQVIEKSIIGLLRASFVCVREIDEVRAVRYDVLRLVVGVGLAVGMK